MPETVIAFGSTAGDPAVLDDREFARQVAWRKSADKRLAKAAGEGNLPALCRGVRRSLADRRAASPKPRRRTEVLPRLLQPLWSQHAWDDPKAARMLSRLLIDLQRRLEQDPHSVSRKLSRRVRSALEKTPIETSPWTHLVWLSVLIATADLLDDAALLVVWRQSLGASISQVAAAPHALTDADDFIDDRGLLTTGELHWLAGLAFADIKGAAKVQRQGKSVLRDQLEAITDSDGSPHARSLHRLPLTLAVLTRSVSAGREFDEKLLGRASADRFEQLITRAAVMSDTQGRLALSNGASFAPGSLLRTASALAGLTAKQPPGRRLRQLPDDAPRPGGRTRKSKHRLPKVKPVRTRSGGEAPSTQSDWAELACLRNNWSAGGDSCIVAHHGVVPQLSVCAFERPLIDGDWQLEVEVEGVPIELTADWSCVCWFSDDDADYVELQQETSGGLTLLRQVLLSRTDHWLLLADNATLQRDAPHGAVQMTARLPLAPEVTTEDNRWTRALNFRTGKLTGGVYPLTLPQERVEKANGSLNVSGDQLILTQTTTGGGGHMPLVIDWSPDRRRAEPLWRQLTVAEDGRRLPPEAACGQRLQIGRHQWLFYRSLQEGQTSRTVLGHHTQHETVIAELTSQGEVEPIVQVE